MTANKISQTARFYLDEFIEDEQETIAEAKYNDEALTAYCFHRFTELGGDEFEATFAPEWYDEEDGWELWARERVV